MRRSLLLVFLFATAARADVDSLLTRWIAAEGGPDHIAKIAAVHRIDATNEDGMTGTREEWSNTSMQRRARTTHEHDDNVTVFDGTRGWRRDWNGFVEQLAGSDLRRQTDLATIHTFAALTGAAGPATAAGDDALEFHPNGGDTVRFTFDPATGLPLRADMPSFDGTLSVAFSDWRDAGGVRVAFAETWTTGPNTTKVQLRSIEFVPRDHVDVTPPAPGPDDVFFLHPGEKKQVIPFNFDNNHIMILGTVNGVGPIWFLVDTGAGYSLFNQSRLGELALDTYGALTTIGGGSAAAGGSYVEHATYRFGDVELRDQHAAVLELRGLEKLYGMPLGGILGFDFLSRFVVDIDYDAKTLTLRPRTWDSSHERGTVVPLVMQEEQPYFAGSITVKGETIPAWFILDVGAADTITFTTPFVAAHDLMNRAGDPERNVRHVTAPDVEAFNPTNVRGLIDSVTLGDLTLPHVVVNFSAAKTGAYTSPAFSGNISETILSRFAHVILDYRRSVMILRPGPRTFEPFEERRSFGMTVISGSPDMHHFVVTAVGEKSAAAAAGFQKGDVIASVDGTAAAQLTLAAVQRALRDEGREHTFVVHRGTEDVTLHATIALTPFSSLK